MPKKIVCLYLLLCLILPLTAYAQLTKLRSAVEDTGLKTEPVQFYVGTLIKTALGFLGIVFLILIIYGGFIWMMARGEEKEVKKAQDLIKAAIIGVAIVLSSYIITDFVLTQVATQIKT